jgi:hypothetical protein
MHKLLLCRFAEKEAEMLQQMQVKISNELHRLQVLSISFSYIPFYEVIICDVSLDLSNPIQVCKFMVEGCNNWCQDDQKLLLNTSLSWKILRWKRSFLFAPWKGSKKIQRNPTKCR